MSRLGSLVMALVAAAALAPLAAAQCNISTVSPLASGTAGIAYSASVSTNGTSATWSATGLPAGLSIAAGPGTTTTIIGTPTVSGVFANIIVTGSPCGSKTFSLTISSKTDISSSLPSPLIFGKPVTFTATVFPATSTGKVVFYNGVNALGGRALTAGRAIFRTEALPAGLNQVTAYYLGDGTNTASTSIPLVVAVQSVSQSGFRAPDSYPNGASGGDPGFVAFGDFNEDGKIDVAVANFQTANVSIYLGSNNGTFSTPTVYSSANSPSGIAVADLDGDGHLDLVVATFGGSSNTVSVLLGTGIGTFGAHVDYQTVVSGTSRPSAVAIGDVNNDRIPDIIVANYAASNVAVLVGVGDGTFGAISAGDIHTVGTNPEGIVVGDFNGDGNLDIATANSGSANFSVLLNAGSGRFGAASNTSMSGSPAAITMGYFNGDTNLDLAFANSGGTVSVFTGDGVGGFALSATVTAGTHPNFIATGDFNGDGKLDLVTANIGSNDVSVVLGNGTGGFGAAASYPLKLGDTQPNFLGVADLNNDGISDLFVPAFPNNNIDVFLGIPTTTTGLTIVPGLIQFTDATTLTATVTSADGTIPAGTVTFLDGATQIGSPVTVNSSGVASFPGVASGSVGTHSITARYNGDGSHATSTSTAVTLTVSKDNTTTTLSASPNPAALSALVTLTANVTAQAGIYQPTGTVQFKDGAASLGGPQTLSGSVATFTTATLSPGSHSLTAVYMGDANANTSTSSAFPENIDNTTTMELTSSVNPSVSGQSVTFTATVTPSSATGAVTFGDNGTAIGTGPLNASGVATFVTNSLALGFHPITASYPGDGNNLASVSSTLTQAVKTASTTSLSVSPVGGTATFGTAVTLTATVTGTSTGRVTFYNGAALLGTSTISGGTATLTTKFLPAGSNKLRAFLVETSFVKSSVSAVTSETITSAPANGLTGVNLTSGGLNGPWSLAAADFNNDGKPDVVVASANAGNGSGHVSVFLGDGTGGFGTGSVVPVADTPKQVVTGDFNGDGNADIASVGILSGALSVRLGDGAGGFGLLTNYTAGIGSHPFALVVGDFDGDGNADIAVVNNQSANISVFLGFGDGSFNSGVTYSAGTNPEGIVAGDFNGDGFTDLAVVNSGDNNISILLNDGSGVFTAGTPVSTGGTLASSVAVGDFNNDGKLDLAATNQTSGDVAIMLGNGNGTFQAAATTGVGAQPTFTAFADVDGDGKIDVIVSNSTADNITVLYGNGTGGIARTSNFPLPSGGTFPVGIAAADFNNDGATDIAVTNYTSNSWTLFQGVRNTSISLSTSVNPTVFSQSTTLTTTVTPAGATGNVQFFDGAVLLSTQPLGGGVATYTTSSLSTGAHGITGVYSGDATNATSTSPSVSQGVNQLSTTTTLNVAPLSAAQGASVTFTATVVPTFGSTVPTGTVTLQDSGVTIASNVPLDGSGVATFTTSTLSIGAHPLTAVYGGDPNDLISTSATVTENIVTTTTTTLTSSRNPATANQNIALTAQVTPGGGSGTVTFKDGSTTLGSPVALDVNGQASITTSLSAAGAHSLNVIYSGDSSFTGSQGSLSLNVLPTTTTSLTAAPATVYFGQAMSLTATVNPPTATGKVVFFDGSTVLGSATLNGSGTAALSTPLVGPGARKLRALYAGSALFGASTSPQVAKTISTRAQSGFDGGTDYSTGPQTITTVVGDFNLDGKQDIAVLDYDFTNGVISILLGNGDGTFNAGPNPHITVGRRPDDLAVGDFNGDGKPDLAFADDTNGLIILAGDGTGNFAALQEQDFGDVITTLAVSDYNSDGIIDLVYGANGGIYYAQGNGDGTFAASVQLVGGEGFPGVTAADLNSDGNPDVVALSGGNVLTVLGNGDGTFQSVQSFPVDSGPTSITVADFSGDGQPDVVVGSNNNGVYYLQGNGDGTLAGFVAVPVGFAPKGVAAGDFDGDGILDILAADVANSSVYVVPSLGGGNFGTPAGTPASTGSRGLTVGNFSGGTGRSDIVFPLVADNVDILLGLPPGVLLSCPTGNTPVVQSVAYSLTCTGSNGLGPYTYSQPSGTMVPGLSLNAATGVISGTAATPGTYAFTIQATDSDVPAQSLTVDLTLTVQPPLILLSSPLAPTTVNAPYTNPLANGGTLPYTCGVTAGNLPAGMSLKASTCLLNGIPTAVGTSSFTVGVSDNGAPPQNATQAYLITVEQATSATGLTSSANPSNPGDSITLTATVTPSGVSGTITFKDGSTTLGSPITLAGGQATLNMSTLTAGTHSLTAVYDGDKNDAGSTSSALTQLVRIVPGITLTPSPTSSAFGQPVTLTASVTGSSPAPSGKITFFDGTTVLGAGTLSGNAASISTPLLSSGTRSLQVFYQGDNTYSLVKTAPQAFTVGNFPQNGLGAATRYTTGGNAFAVAVGDFNGDGIEDIASSTFSGQTNQIAIQLGNGDGTFPSTPVYYNSGTPALGIVVADVNNDGLADLVLATPGAGGITVLLNAGGGVFGNPAVYGTGGSPESIAVTDYTGDGIPDVMVANSGGLVLMTGSGTGAFTFTPGFSQPTSGATYIAAADFNSDGNADVIAIDNNGTAYVLLGVGTGTFQAATTYFLGITPISVTTADFNRDGHPDVLIGDSGAGVKVMLGSATGVLGAAVNYPAGFVPGTVSTGDFNGDGKLDIATGDLSGPSVSVLAGNGDGTFQPKVTFPTIGTAYAIAAGNFRGGDGRTDLASAGGSDSNVDVLLSQIPQVSITCTPGAPPVVTNVSYAITCPASSGVAPYTYSISAGALPNGLSINSNTGTISGTPTTPGTFNFTVKAVDSDTPAQNATTSVSVMVVPQLIMLTSPLSPGTVTVPYTVTLASGGTPAYTCSLSSGSLPTGLALTASTCVLSGTPAVPGPYSFTVGVTDSGTPAQSNSTAYSLAVQQVTSTTSLTSSVNPSAFNSATLLTATVSPASATSTVTFRDGSTPLGSPVTLNASGVATLSLSSLTAGSHSLTAVYSGDTNDGASTSNSLTQNVVLAPTATVLSSSLNPALPGQSITFTATVIPAGVTGTVTFNDGGSPLGRAVSISGGEATFAISTLAPGPHTITATYGGDSSYAASVSSLIRSQLNFFTNIPGTITDSSGLGIGFTTRLPGTGGNFTGNDPNLTLNTGAGTLGLTSTAADLNGQGNLGVAEFLGLPLSSIGVTNNEDFSVIATFNNWQYSESVDQLGVFVGSSITTAFRGGGLVFAPTPFAFTVQTVNGNDNGLQQDAAQAPGAGDNVTLTMSRTNGNWSLSLQDLTSPARSGSVPVAQPAFLNGLSGLIAGVFAGSPGGTPKSETISSFALAVPVETIGTLPSTIVLTSSANPSIVGNSIMLTATVSPTAATGTVTFDDGTGTIGTGDLDGGVATLNISSLGFGAHPLTAVYSGDGITATSTSAGLNQTVNFTTLTIATANLPAGTAGTTYAAVTMEAGGGSGSYTWSATGQPQGITMTAVGVLGGSSSVAFSGPVTITVTDTVSTLTADRVLTLTINSPPPPPVTNAPPLQLSGPTNLGSATGGGALSGNFSASGGTPPYTYSIAGGSAIFGIDGNGHLTGTPSAVGDASVTVQVTDSKLVIAQASATYSVFGFITTALPSGSVSVNYSGSVGVAGGTGPYTLLATGVPAGLSFSAGTLSGKPQTAGSFAVTVQASDAKGLTVSHGFSISIAPAPPPPPNPTPLLINTTSLAAGAVGQPYSQVLAAGGGSPGYTWALTGGALPAGLSLDASGNVAGLPSAPGSYSFGVQVADTTGGKVIAAISLNILPAPLQITTGATLPAGMKSVDYPAQTLTGSGGVGPYAFSITGSLPEGLTLTNGQITGNPSTPGTSGFTLKVTDSATPANSASLAMTVTIRPDSADLLLSTGSVSFSLIAGSSGVPDPAVVTASSTDVSQVLSFTTLVASAPWLSLSAATNTPGNISIGLTEAALSLNSSGSPYSATVTVTCISGPCAGKSQSIGVTLVVADAPPALGADSTLFSFVSTTVNPQSSSASLGVRNAGGGTLKINGILAADPWISVGTLPATLAAGPGVTVTITATPGSLGAGFYLSSVNVLTSAGNVSIPVSLLITADSTMNLGPSGAQFSMTRGGALGNPNGSFLVSVNKSSPVNFTATALPGAPWLRAGTGSASGNSSPGVVSYSIDPSVSTLAAGAYYATIRINADGIVNAPQDFQIVLSIAPASTPVAPDPQPAGLLFLSATPGAQAQLIQVYASSITPLPYQASASTNDGGSWLSIDATTGSAIAGTPGTVKVSVKSDGLKPGIYRGTVSFASGSSVRSVNVTLVVETPAASPPSSPSSVVSPLTRFKPAADAPICAGATLVATQTGLVSNFSAPASWPTPLAIKLVDSCGSLIGQGQIVATFSNGDPPLELAPVDPANGVYSGTWTPRKTSSQITIAAHVTVPGYPAASVQIAGTVTPNAAPQLAPNGTFDVFHPQVGAGLGPGNIVQIYGSSLASQTAAPQVLPLPVDVQGTQVIIGGVQSPLFYVSPGQVNAQIPFELEAGKQYQVIVSANGALTTPQPIQLNAGAPAVLQFTSGLIVAQHQDGTLISATAPAAPGEFIVLYMSGLGATDITVPSGQPSPSNPPANVLDPPVLTMNGRTVPILFAGLTPSLVGLYQINVQVPADLTDGSYDVIVSQSGVVSNTTSLPLKK